MLNRTEAIIKQSAEKIKGLHFNLPSNKKILFVRHNYPTDTTLTLYAPENLNKPLLEKTLPGNYEVILTFPDDSLLLSSKSIYHTKITLVKLNASLQITKNKEYDSSDSSANFLLLGAIDNNTFFRIVPNINWQGSSIIISNLIDEEIVANIVPRPDNQSHFKSCHTVNYFSHHSGGYYALSNLQRFGNQIFCCNIENFIDKKFEVLVFKVISDANAVTIKELQLLSFNTRKAYSSFHTIALPDGNLFAQENGAMNVTIWNPISGKRVDAWQWPDLFSVSRTKLSIQAFPYPKYLFIFNQNATNSLYLFATETKTLKEIQFPGNLVYDVFRILPNGELLATAYDKAGYMNMMCFDLKENPLKMIAKSKNLLLIQGVYKKMLCSYEEQPDEEMQLISSSSSKHN